jgi:hypothetical protein
VLRTKQGYLLDISRLVSIIWQDLLRQGGDQPLPVAEAWIALLVLAGLCLLLLMRKIKAAEVIR